MHGHGRQTQAWKTAKVGPPYVGGLGHDMVFHKCITMGLHGA